MQKLCEQNLKYFLAGERYGNFTVWRLQSAIEFCKMHFFKFEFFLDNLNNLAYTKRPFKTDRLPSVLNFAF